jgi:hypothetical protein
LDKNIRKHLAVSYQLEGGISLPEELKVRHEKDDQLNLVIYYLHASFREARVLEKRLS